MEIALARVLDCETKMSRTHKDIPWKLKHEKLWGDFDPARFRKIKTHTGYADRWRSLAVVDRGSERGSWKTFNSRNRDFYNSFGETDDSLLEPQTRTEYVH